MKFCCDDAQERASKIKLIIFDCDGVLTEGGIYIGANCELFKPFYCRDGLGITLMQKMGIRTAIITGRTSPHVAFRAAEIHMGDVIQGKLDKREVYRNLRDKYDLKDEEVAYVGDDLVDLPIMVKIGLPAAVGDAVPEVKERAAIVSDFPGGRGAIREIAEFILKSQGLWQKIMDNFLEPDDVDGLVQ